MLKLGRFVFEPCRARVRGRPPIDEWEGPLRFALWCQRASPWWIGDLLNSGDVSFGEIFYQICESYGVSPDQLDRYRSVARRVPAANRRANLSWSAHAMVARLPVDEQADVLLEAETKGWSSEEIRRKLRSRAEADKAPKASPEPGPDNTKTKSQPKESQ